MSQTIDADEVEKFDRLASEWWNPRSKFRPLHKFNPVRLGYIRERTIEHFSLDGRAERPLEGLRFLDIGCGGGLLSEPMARLGADVVGVDPAANNVEAARVHADRSGVGVDYRVGTAEDLADAGETFDVVLNMEVIEHVADVEAYMAACCRMVRPDGLHFVATINRTLKALGLAIFGAEYVLRWLPRGTHSYEKLVKPDEVEAAMAANGLHVLDLVGVAYNPLGDRFRLSDDTDVNYMMLGARRA